MNNLFDGVNRTRDDMHLWLTPWSDGSAESRHKLIHVYLNDSYRLAMIRIWVCTFYHLYVKVCNMLIIYRKYCLIFASEVKGVELMIKTREVELRSMMSCFVRIWHLRNMTWSFSARKLDWYKLNLIYIWAIHFLWTLKFIDINSYLLLYRAASQ